MPELPDLQVIGSNLDKMFKGKKLNKFTLEHKKNFKGDPVEIKDMLEGKKLEKVYREGKELRFKFGKDQILGVHLMLHGAFHRFEHKNENTHTLAEFLFEGNEGLALTDYQGLATLSMNPTESESPDALSAKITPAFLKAQMSSSKATVKKLLTNQHILRGIGNAYADEILWDARISPFSICNKIPPEAIKALSGSIHQVLTDAEKQIRKDHPGIIAGEVRDFLKIHHPRKENSPTGKPIHVKKSGGSTYYTEDQKLYK